MQELFGQIFGILGLIVTVVCYQFNDSRRILIAQIVASGLFVINLALLGGITGAILNIYGICRALVYYQREKHQWARSPWWVVVFVLAAVGITVLTFTKWYDIFPMIGMISTAIALSLSDAGKIRLFTLPSPPCWFIYNLLTGNIGGVMNELFVIGSIVVGMIRLDRKKGEQKGK